MGSNLKFANVLKGFDGDAAASYYTPIIPRIQTLFLPFVILN